MFGVLCGDVIGVGVTAAALPGAQVAVIALCVVCVTLIILPPLDRQLTLLLKSHAYLTAYSVLPEETRQEVAAESFITENTVKTHLSRVYSKYAAASRAELISLLLRSQER